jgi:hypothetical protein
MQGSKLIQIVKTFSDEDWAALRLMTVSPYYISGREAEKVQRLLELLYLAKPDFGAQQLSVETGLFGEGGKQRPATA